MTTAGNTGRNERRPVTAQPDSISSARVPPAGVPAYYLGRPAHVWMDVFRPRARHAAAPPADAGA